jgi:hypothetical protein
MNIYALEGFKVKVTPETLKNGYNYDSDLVKKNLEINKSYTVLRTHVHSSSTDVILKEFPEIKFNSVNFEDITDQPVELNCNHADWYKYNK